MDFQGKGIKSPDKDTCSKATIERNVRSAVIEYVKEIEDKLSRMRNIIDDTQLQQTTDRTQNSKTTHDIMQTLRSVTARVDKAESLLREAMIDIESALRLERAAMALQGHTASPPPQETDPSPSFLDTHFSSAPLSPLPTAEARLSGSSAFEGPGTGRAPLRAAVTGGLVELRGADDFERLLREGDAWVVMFHAPWCATCAEALPEFQQAALQAPVHFARCAAPPRAQGRAAADASGAVGALRVRRPGCVSQLLLNVRIP